MTELSRVECLCCGRSSDLISEALPVCLKCIRSRFDKAKTHVEQAHRRSRIEFDLPYRPPKDEAGVRCKICTNQCQIPQGERGFCGLRENKKGRLFHLAGTKQKGLVNWYYDPLPTNCVADWICPAGSETGYPSYSYTKGIEYGYENLAVFYEACSYNCLFCQNWHFRRRLPSGRTIRAIDLAEAVRETTACICYFGGDPTPQLDHALAASRLAIDKAKNRILRICWETNGSMERGLLKKMAELSLKTGGCIKFDLKALDEKLNVALCGVSNQQTLENFRWLARFSQQRPDPPLLVASTLLIPGYIDQKEIYEISRFIASLDRKIPYSILGFYPSFLMNDLPRTSRRHAEQSLQVAKEAGLKRIRIGNLHFLSDDY